MIDVGSVIMCMKLSEESNVTAEVAWFLICDSLQATTMLPNGGIWAVRNPRRNYIRLHARTYQEQSYVALAEICKLKLLR